MKTGAMETVRTAGIAAVAGLIGGTIGALLVGVGLHPPKTAPGAEVVHTQDVTLCTTYALVTAAIRHPIESGSDVLPAIAPLRLALVENPDATPEIRDAISGAIGGFDAILARGVAAQGSSEPPSYDQAAVNADFSRAAKACGLAE